MQARLEGDRTKNGEAHAIPLSGFGPCSLHPKSVCFHHDGENADLRLVARQREN